MTRYCVWTLAREGYPHSAAFDELSDSLWRSLEQLGHDVRAYHGTDPNRAAFDTWDTGNAYRPIVLGAHLAPSWGIEIPTQSIVYNTEQRRSSWMTREYLEILSRCRVWNVFGEHGSSTAERFNYSVVRPGYHPCLETIDRTVPRPADVAFVGSMNDRRERVIKQMQDLGLIVDWRFNCYGEERDRLYSECKLALNMHYDENSEHESVRCSYLQANRIPVLSEWNLPSSPYRRPGVSTSTYADLAKQARWMIDYADTLDSVGQNGYEAIRRIPMVREVDRAL